MILTIAAGIFIAIVCLMVLPYVLMLIFGVALHILGFIFAVMGLPVSFLRRSPEMLREFNREALKFKEWWKAGCPIKYKTTFKWLHWLVGPILIGLILMFLFGAFKPSPYLRMDGQPLSPAPVGLVVFLSWNVGVLPYWALYALRNPIMNLISKFRK